VKKLIIYYNFIVVSFIVFTGFLTAESVGQVIGATLFYPIFVYFSLLVIPNRQKAITLPKEVSRAEKLTRLDAKKSGGQKKFDIDRRAFIKLIGSTGTAVFFLSVFGIKKAEAAFFGSVPGPGIIGLKDAAGLRIDPAEKHPTDGYKISEIDDSSLPSYYGFVDKSGAWFIQREGSAGDYRYTKGSSSFASNWSNRTSLSYDYFDNVF